MPPARRRTRLTGASAIAAAVLALAGCVFPDDGSTPTPQASGKAPVSRVTAAPSASPSFGTPHVEVGYNIDDPDSITVVVTKRRPLDPLKYKPKDLAATGVPGGGQMRKEAAEAIKRMHTAAKADGAPFSVSTAYRSYDFQSSIYYTYVAQRGVARTDRSSARPGYSEHQTGLAADVYDVRSNHLTHAFGYTDTGVWLREHGHEYGFIISYPEGKEHVTGYIWEPWHIRYVGVELATDMKEQGIQTLQEYFDLEYSPDYG